ncbi:RNA polymerase sigma factor [Microvirga sp. TS319]|uniref:RNA polymerase sigma factor n=1 Tax=Microvirga sp. TS319 TaxID=3241165 RepID=UPI003519F006
MEATRRDPQAGEAAERVARHSYGKLVAYLAARTRDIAGAEDALSEAFAAALDQWETNGIPYSPEGWLLTVARRRMIDTARQRETRAGAAEHLKLLVDELRDAGDGSDIPDQRLRLMFACAHPAIDRQIRSPLILQTILGFDAATIAGCYLVSPATMGQRLVRAKTKIKQAGIAFRLPDHAEMPERLDAVLEAIYAAFAEGWSDPSGTDQRRRELAQEALWLGRLVARLLPDEPEVLGLLALMLHLEARRGARRDHQGAYIPLNDQDPSRWHAMLIGEAEDILLGASHMGRIGRYQLEAAMQSAHAVRRFGQTPDWTVLETLYDALLAITGSPVVAINRAMVIAEARSPEDGLAILCEVENDQRLAGYQPYWAARAELLARCGQPAAADQAYACAIRLEPDPSVRQFLQARREAIQTASAASESSSKAARMEGQ